jgi:hypothetical protein
MYRLSEIVALDIELSSRCNAACGANNPYTALPT